jgi:hypothetical protein
MDYVSLFLIGLFVFVLGFYCGGRYRKARLHGKTRAQALAGIVIQGGGGPPPVR